MLVAHWGTTRACAVRRNVLIAQEATKLGVGVKIVSQSHGIVQLKYHKRAVLIRQVCSDSCAVRLRSVWTGI